jgi:hypothetical protein
MAERSKATAPKMVSSVIGVRRPLSAWPIHCSMVRTSEIAWPGSTDCTAERIAAAAIAWAPGAGLTTTPMLSVGICAALR